MVVAIDDYYASSYFSTIPGERSPLKNNAFFRTSHSNRDKKKWCVCGRQLVFFKEAECWSCTECGHTEYIEQKKKEQQQQQQQQANTGSGGVMSVDGLSDARTTPNRGATKFRHIKDPRARLLKPKSRLDPELQKQVDEQGVRIVRYEERIEQSNDVVTSDDLRANK